MQNPNIISLNDIDSFIKKCSQGANDDYEPYIDYDLEPQAIKSSRTLPLLANTGIELFEDKNNLALYIVERTHGIIGCCTAFPYYDDDDILTYELSVLVAPEYRRHGLGRMLVMQMMFIIEEINEKNIKENIEKNNAEFTQNETSENSENECGADNSSINSDDIYSPHILLTGSNEHFAQGCGFSYSHSEHFMTRKPYSQLDTTHTLANHNDIGQEQHIKHGNIADCKSNHSKCSIAITRTSHKAPGHHTYRLFCDGSSASKCTVLECSDYVNIANVYTNKKYRGRRFAGQLINTVATDFPQKKLLLQVSGSNTAAIHAYTEAGFTFLKTFDYYILNH